MPGRDHRPSSRLKFLLAAKLGWLFILLMGRLTRVRVVGYSNFRRATEGDNGVLAIIWHGRILLPIYMHRNQGVSSMVSLHEDGEMIAQAVHRLGYVTVRGSSSRGGREAFHEMLRKLRRGTICTLMPDGPRGPRHHLKLGAIHLASRSGAYLLPMTFSCERKIVARSWDKFLLWLPFSKSILLYGDPILAPREMTDEETECFRKRVEKEMIDLEQRADAYFPE